MPTLKSEYDSADGWAKKATIMEVYFLMNTTTVKEIASYFGVSVGLTSENLKLAREINRNSKLLKCKTRQDALRKCR